MILRRQDITNNNGISTSRKRDKTNTNIKMPPIGNKQQTNEQVSHNYDQFSIDKSCLLREKIFSETDKNKYLYEKVKVNLEI